jgi:hypothetical protein
MHVKPWDWMVSAWRDRPAQLPAQPTKSDGFLPASIDEHSMYSIARLQPQEQKRAAHAERAGAKRDRRLGSTGANARSPAEVPVQGMHRISTLQQHTATNGHQSRRGYGDTQADARQQRQGNRAHQGPAYDEQPYGGERGGPQGRNEVDSTAGRPWLNLRA